MTPQMVITNTHSLYYYYYYDVYRYYGVYCFTAFIVMLLLCYCSYCYLILYYTLAHTHSDARGVLMALYTFIILFY